MLKEENRIRAMAKLGRHMNKSIGYVKTAIYQSCVDIAFSKDAIDHIVEEVFDTPQDEIESEIKSALGQLTDSDIDNDRIIEALNRLGKKPTPVN